MKKTCIAICGYGGMGSHHARLLQTMPEFHLIGILDIAPDRVEEAKKQSLTTYPDLDALLSDKTVDIVLIATPNHIHKDISIAALRAGKHVICEKPVSMSSAELLEIMAAAKETGNTFVVHQNRRWDEDFRVIKLLYDTNALGPVFNIESRVQGSRGIPGDWRKEKQFGGGMMLDWQVHLLDQLLWMVKEPIQSVYCQLSFQAGEEVDDGAKIYLTFASGLTAYLEVSTCHYISLPRWYVNGRTGAAVINDWSVDGHIMRLYSDKGRDAKPIITSAGLTKTMAPRDETTVVEEPLPRIQLDVRDFYRNVIASIQGKEEMIVKNEEVLRVMRLMEAAFASHEQNQVIQLEG